MKLLFVFTVIFAAVMLMVAIKDIGRHLFSELGRMKALLDWGTERGSVTSCGVFSICLLLLAKIIKDYG